MTLPSEPDAGRFDSTHWSLVLRAKGGDSVEADAALAELCRDYWYPLYAFIRRRGHSADDAADLTQEFFARFLEKDFLRSVDQGRGRFRSFLLACCKHFLSNEADRERAARRGGGRAPLSLDAAGAAERYSREPADTRTPEKLFERRWALTLLDRVLDRLQRECEASGKGALFEHLKAALAGGPDTVPYCEVGKQLGLSEDAVKQSVRRLRQRYRDLLRREIAATVEDSRQVDDEIRDLFAALGGA